MVAGIALELLLRYVHHFLLDERSRPVAFVEATLQLLRPLGELLKLGEIIDNMLACADFTLHNIIFVEEYYQTGGGKETILPDGAEQIKRLL